MTTTAAEAAVRVLDGELLHRPSADERWLAERGIRLRWPPRAERPTAVPSVDELETRAEFLRDALVDEPEMPACSCLVPHRLASSDTLAAWPPKRRHARLPFDTGLRRNAFGPRHRNPWPMALPRATESRPETP